MNDIEISFDFSTSKGNNKLVILGMEANNIKCDLTLPHDRIIALTGVSGAGKTTMLNIIYKYTFEPYYTSLNTVYHSANIFHNSKINHIEGIRPSILMHQKNIRAKNKSTVGTVTEISKYLRYVFSIQGVSIPFSPITKKRMEKVPIHQLLSSVVEQFSSDNYSLSLVLNFYIDTFESLKEIVYLLDVKYIEIHNIRYLSAAELEKDFVSGMYIICILQVGIANLAIQQVEEKLKGIDVLKDNLNITGIKPYIRVNDKNDVIINERFITNSFYCQEAKIIIDKVTPKLFSFNTPEGSCKVCHGLGYERYIDVDKVIPNSKLSINQGGILIWKTLTKNIKALCMSLASAYNFDLDAPIESFNSNVMDIILYGDQKTVDKSSNAMMGYGHNNVFWGVMNILEEKMNSSSFQVRNSIDKFLSYRDCQKCLGFRLSKESLCFQINGKHIGEVNNFNMINLEIWLRDLLTKYKDTRYMNILLDLIKPILKKILTLKEIGLNYLSLSRFGNTLSGGELQRLRLAEQLQHKLSGVIFILDEPSSGLHCVDQQKVINVIKYLQKLGNTIILVEHNLSFVKIASHVVDIGPKAGVFGGKIVAQGDINTVCNEERSITGQYLSGKRYINYNNAKELDCDQFICLENAHSNNLKNVSLKIPLGKCTIVSGPSGCGKTSLIMNTLYKGLMKEINGVYLPNIGKYDYLFVPNHVKGVMNIDQKPIGKTSRSNLSTYIGIFDEIRDVFAAQPLAQKNKFTASYFSFNIKDGSCILCLGTGYLRSEINNVFSSSIICEECQGKRYKKEVLEVQYKGKSIASVLEMSVDEARNFFRDHNVIFELLDILNDIGLGYLKLGHSAMNFSGGETQRIKICKELSRFFFGSKGVNKNDTKHVVYIIDELNVGLHIYDTDKVLKMIERLTKDNTVIIIDHNIDSIKRGDYIIDMGPGSSEKGGRIIAEGTPLQLIENPNSITGPFLKKRIEEDDAHHKKYGRKN
ncbi:MAG: excinuclease ABC subunit UvrA [Pseudomonadota bacterium]